MMPVRHQLSLRSLMIAIALCAIAYSDPGNTAKFWVGAFTLIHLMGLLGRHHRRGFDPI
jgi:hypothetical protein